MFDQKALVQLLSDPIFRDMTRSIPYPYTSSDARAWIALQQDKSVTDATRAFAIREKCDNTLLGMVGVYQVHKEQTEVEVGYWVGKAYWGRGVATEALHAFLIYLNEMFSFRTAIAHTLVGNDASARVLEKCQFAHTQTLEKYLQKDGQVFAAKRWERSFKA